MFGTAETNVMNDDKVLVEWSVNLSHCEIELIQAIFECDTSQTLLHRIMAR